MTLHMAHAQRALNDVMDILSIDQVWIGARVVKTPDWKWIGNPGQGATSVAKFKYIKTN